MSNKSFIDESVMYDELTMDLAWRKKEVLNLSSSIIRNGIIDKPFLRAGIALLYAHWEGFIKSSTESYLNYINSKRHRYCDLNRKIVGMALRKEIGSSFKSNKAIDIVKCIDRLFESKSINRFRLSFVVDTKSNLSSIVFKEIIDWMDISDSKYVSSFILIDSQLVGMRNRIAHGEYLEIDSQEYQNVRERVLMLMDNYREDICINVRDKKYLNSR